MNYFKLYFILLFLFLFFTGCLSPKQVILNPQIDIPQSNPGSQETVYLKVLDERPEKNFGRYIYAVSGQVKNDQDVAEILRGTISEGLIKKGFRVEATTNQSPNKLRVEIRNIEFTPENARSGLKVTCKNPLLNYKNFYRATSDRRGNWEQTINTTISEVLKKMFDDKTLFNCLEKKQ